MLASNVEPPFHPFSAARQSPMAASLHRSVLLRNPNHNRYGIRVGATIASLPSSAASFPLAAVPRGLAPDCSLLFGISYGSRKTAAKKKNSDIEVEKDNDNANLNAGGSQEAWKEALERLKAEALNVKSVSEEVYQVYSMKAIEMLMHTSENLKIQADKAQRDLSVIAQEIAKEGQEYLSTASKNYPDSIREILEDYASVEELNNISSVRDFYLGIPYGCFLAVGGFLHFMLTGSIPAIRLGVILGPAILALSVSSLRAWNNGKETPLLLVGQTAISAIIFFRQWLLCSQINQKISLGFVGLFVTMRRGLFPNLLMLSISGAMLGFYIYRIAIDRYNKGDNLVRIHWISGGNTERGVTAFSTCHCLFFLCYLIRHINVVGIGLSSRICFESF